MIVSGVSFKNVDYFKFEIKGQFIYFFAKEFKKNTWVYLARFNEFSDLEIFDFGKNKKLESLKSLRKIIIKGSELSYVKKDK